MKEFRIEAGQQVGFFELVLPVKGSVEWCVSRDSGHLPHAAA